MLAIGTLWKIEIMLPPAGGAFFLGHSIAADGIDGLVDQRFHEIEGFAFLPGCSTIPAAWDEELRLAAVGAEPDLQLQGARQNVGSVAGQKARLTHLEFLLHGKVHLCAAAQAFKLPHAFSTAATASAR